VGNERLGDQVGFLLKPLAAESVAGGQQMTFQQAGTIEPGHAP